MMLFKKKNNTYFFVFNLAKNKETNRKFHMQDFRDSTVP